MHTHTHTHTKINRNYTKSCVSNSLILKYQLNNYSIFNTVFLFFLTTSCSPEACQFHRRKVSACLPSIYKHFRKSNASSLNRLLSVKGKSANIFQQHEIQFPDGLNDVRGLLLAYVVVQILRVHITIEVGVWQVLLISICSLAFLSSLHKLLQRNVQGNFHSHVYPETLPYLFSA